MEHKVAGNLENEITKKENSSGKSELLAGDRQLSVHRQRRKSKVDAIDKGDNVEGKQEREEPDLELANRPGLDSRAFSCFLAHIENVVRLNVPETLLLRSNPCQAASPSKRPKDFYLV